MLNCITHIYNCSTEYLYIDCNVCELLGTPLCDVAQLNLDHQVP